MREKTERNQQIIAAYKGGQSATEIARHYWLTTPTVYAILRKARLPRNQSYKCGWRGNSEAHRAAGQKGGKMVSQSREHMAEIGRRGGTRVSQDRAHMAAIGRKGGANSQKHQREREKEDLEYTESWVSA